MIEVTRPRILAADTPLRGFSKMNPSPVGEIQERAGLAHDLEDGLDRLPGLRDARVFHAKTIVVD